MNKTRILITGLVMAMAAGKLGATQLSANQSSDKNATLREVFDRGTGSVGKINLPSVKAQPALGGIQNYQPLASAQPELTKKSARPAGPEKTFRSLRGDTSGAMGTGAAIALAVIGVAGMAFLGFLGGDLLSAALMVIGASIIAIAALRSRKPPDY